MGPFPSLILEPTRLEPKLLQIVATFYDEFYDVLCQRSKETAIVTKRSQIVVARRKIVVTFYYAY